jgi:gamma-glutamylcyclotransferase (GGCT)/AIG2-like uncharacterized protein YtfP
MHKVFVYGTLRNNEPATHKLMCYTMRKVPGKEFDFPFVEYDEDTRSGVLGNIIEVNDKELAQLDIYEGVAHGLYSRIRRYVRPLDDTGDASEVWVYIGGPALVYPIIESNDWFNQ